MTVEQVAEYMPSATCPEDRFNRRLPAVDAWEREKQAARRSWLREFGKALAYAAAVAVALKMMGAV